MSFSAPGDGGAAAGNHGAGDVATQHDPSFGQRLGDYFQSKNPVVGSLAHQVFGSNGGGDVAQQAGGGIPQAGPNPAPAMASMSLGNENQPDYSGIIAQNAKPPEGSGGLSALLKLIGI